jgi:metal transporter CNNM
MLFCVLTPSFSLSLSLYRVTLNEIMTKGHSRVPVYAGNSKNVVGLILVISFLSVSVIQLIFFFFFFFGVS